MAGINLLPQELKPSGYAIKASKKLRQFAILSIVVLVIAAIGFTVVSAYLSIQTKRIATNEDKLKRDIKNLEQTEQKLVLIKDRLSGVEKIISNKSAQEEVAVLKSIIEKNPQNVKILGAKLDTKEIIISLGFENSSYISTFYSLLLNSNFKSIALESFNFNPKTGYTVDISISN